MTRLLNHLKLKQLHHLSFLLSFSIIDLVHRDAKGAPPTTPVFICLTILKNYSSFADTLASNFDSYT